jgi:hypothetical protein
MKSDFIAGENARRGSFIRLARHRAMRRWQAGRHGSAARVSLPEGARHEHARLDTRQGLPALSAGEPPERPNCGSRDVVVLITIPRESLTARAAKR